MGRQRADRPAVYRTVEYAEWEWPLSPERAWLVALHQWEAVGLTIIKHFGGYTPARTYLIVRRSLADYNPDVTVTLPTL